MALTPYEREREARMAQNRARMALLGLTQTSQRLRKAQLRERQANRRSNLGARRPRPVRAGRGGDPTWKPPPAERRRSPRVAGKPAPTYSEKELEDLGRQHRREVRELRPALRDSRETYTAEHKAALGSTEKEWELFVDGYRADGTRIYDSVRGQTCHQCRQKTMGKRTQCSECGSLHGVFCGDCLYMRYGEHVDEARANKCWVCPPCRDLCNCSFCRQRKGWPPTGQLYRRAIREGHRSVAHYLVDKFFEEEADEAEGAGAGGEESDKENVEAGAAGRAAREATAFFGDVPLSARMKKRGETGAGGRPRRAVAKKAARRISEVFKVVKRGRVTGA